MNMRRYNRKDALAGTPTYSSHDFTKQHEENEEAAHLHRAASPPFDSRPEASYDGVGSHNCRMPSLHIAGLDTPADRTADLQQHVLTSSACILSLLIRFKACSAPYCQSAVCQPASQVPSEMRVLALSTLAKPLRGQERSHHAVPKHLA